MCRVPAPISSSSAALSSAGLSRAERRRPSLTVSRVGTGPCEPYSQSLLPLPLSPSPPPLVGSPSGLGFCEGELPSESSGAARAPGVPNAWRRAGSSAKLSAPPRLYIAVGRPGTVGRPQSAVCQSASQPLGAKGWPASRLVAGRCSRVLLHLLQLEAAAGASTFRPAVLKRTARC